MSESKHPANSPRRWYDQDPLLTEVLDLLRDYPTDVREQAQTFLGKIEEQIGKETLEKFYELSKPEKTGNRWYDADPLVSKAIELLRVVPPEVQRQAAHRFLESMKKHGLSPELLKSDPASS
jgi:cell division protein FtsI/penicillin-binding protein 2